MEDYADVRKLATGAYLYKWPSLATVQSLSCTQQLSHGPLYISPSSITPSLERI